MSQKTMIALAGSVTAFILVIAGGVFASLSGGTASAAAAPVATLSPAVRDLLNQREAAYQALIDQANQRLLAAEQSSVAVDATPDASEAYAPSLSQDEAAILALRSAPGAGLTGQPELVEFQGTPAFEVPTTFGPVYIDAISGSVLYNGAAQVFASAAPHEWQDSEYDD
jgi:hypothetical protein